MKDTGRASGAYAGVESSEMSTVVDATGSTTGRSVVASAAKSVSVTGTTLASAATASPRLTTVST